MKVAPGERLCSKGDEADTLFVVVDGPCVARRAGDPQAFEFVMNAPTVFGGPPLPLASSCAPSILPLIPCHARPVTRPRSLGPTPASTEQGRLQSQVGRNWASHLPLPSPHHQRCRAALAHLSLPRFSPHHCQLHPHCYPPPRCARRVCPLRNEAMRTRLPLCSQATLAVAQSSRLAPPQRGARGHQLQRHTNDGTVSLRPFAAAHPSPLPPCGHVCRCWRPSRRLPRHLPHARSPLHQR